MARVIKRYANRKLYDTKTSSYITLDGIAALVREGQDIRVVDNDNGEDLTTLTFAQIILEEEKRKNGLLSLPSLRWIIREGEERIQELMSTVDRGREVVRGSVERLVGGHGNRGLLGDLLDKPQKGLDQLQRQIDDQVRRSVQRLAGHPTVQAELKRIQTSLQRLEREVSRLQRKSSRPAAKRSRRAAE